MIVSALMPTYNRREFISRSISCFLEQRYPPDWNVELVVLDDGTDPVKDLLPPDDRIKYFYEQPKKNHGEKMNRCFELMQGEYGIVWDDDDFYIPTRLARQIAPFLGNPALQVTGTSTLYYYEHGTQRAWRYTCPRGINWLASIAVRKAAWEQCRFDAIAAGADYNFAKRLPAEARHDLNDASLVVASVHSANACQKALGNSYTPVPWAVVGDLLKPRTSVLADMGAPE
jgi:glycosyltransferase involved in cell wall biosynthesis